jgi:hypothetical protein
MFTNIDRIVSEDVSIRVNQYNVLYEAITNSIHSNSTNIDCRFDSNDYLLDEDNDHIFDRKVDDITVIDNGDGFNSTNYNSFCNYRSALKKDIGGKGVGRFTYLKVYNHALFKSELEKENVEISFDFTRNFDTEDIVRLDKDVQANKTTVRFHSITKKYKDDKRRVDRRIYLNVNEIRERIFHSLVPILYFYQSKNGIDIHIKLTDLRSQDESYILPSDIPTFKHNNFPITDTEGKVHRFTLHYNIEDKPGPVYSFYCADNRTVNEMSDKGLKVSFPIKYKGILLLESSYLNKTVNNERNGFDIFPVKTDIYSTISWDMINEAVKHEISKIVKNEIPDTEAINREKIREIEEERPYLLDYIEEEDVELAGFIDKKQIIDRAKKRFDKSKEKVLSNSTKSKITESDLREAIELTQNELVSYIFDRVKVIEKMKRMVDDKEKIEKIIHDLIMAQNSESTYFSMDNNNLWILDDRYISYTYAASDRRVKDVLKQVDSYSPEDSQHFDRPDISIFFSHKPTDKERLKSVIVELKPFDQDKKADKKRFAGIQQLLDYADAFKEKEKIEEVWCFLITDVDEKLSSRLIRDGYTKLFSTFEPIYHRVYDNEVSIYVVSAKTLISDAEARNKTFLDIIRKKKNLARMLEE